MIDLNSTTLSPFAPKITWHDVSSLPTKTLSSLVTPLNVEQTVVKLTIDLLASKEPPSKDTTQKLCDIIRPMELPFHLRDRFFWALSHSKLFSQSESAAASTHQNTRRTFLTEILMGTNPQQHGQTIARMLLTTPMLINTLSKNHQGLLIQILCKEVANFGRRLYPCIRTLLTQKALDKGDDAHHSPLNDFIHAGGNLAELFSDMDVHFFKTSDVLSYLRASAEIFQYDESSHAFIALYNWTVRGKLFTSSSLEFFKDSKLIAIAQYVDSELSSPVFRNLLRDQRKFDRQASEQHSYLCSLVNALDRLTSIQIITFLDHLTEPSRSLLKNYYQRASTGFQEQKKRLYHDLLLISPFLKQRNITIPENIEYLFKKGPDSTTAPIHGPRNMSHETARTNLTKMITQAEVIFTWSNDPEFAVIHRFLKDSFVKILPPPSKDSLAISETAQAIADGPLTNAKFLGAKNAVDMLLTTQGDAAEIDWDLLVETLYASYDITLLGHPAENTFIEIEKWKEVATKQLTDEACRYLSKYNITNVNMLVYHLTNPSSQEGNEQHPTPTAPSHQLTLEYGSYDHDFPSLKDSYTRRNKK